MRIWVKYVMEKLKKPFISQLIYDIPSKCWIEFHNQCLLILLYFMIRSINKLVLVYPCDCTLTEPHHNNLLIAGLLILQNWKITLVRWYCKRTEIFSCNWSSNGLHCFKSALKYWLSPVSTTYGHCGQLVSPTDLQVKNPMHASIISGRISRPMPAVF